MPFKILRKNCAGADVHKTWIYVCIGITDDKGRTEYHQQRFSSFMSIPVQIRPPFRSFEYRCSGGVIPAVPVKQYRQIRTLIPQIPVSEY